MACVTRRPKEIAMNLPRFVFTGIVSLSVLQGAHAVQDGGMVAGMDADFLDGWRGRMSLGGSVLRRPSNPLAYAGSSGDATGLKINGLSLMGDYFFGRSLVGNADPSGFRTTGGVFYGPRSQLTAGRPLVGNQRSLLNFDRYVPPASDAPASDSSADVSALPYLGVGYTGLSVKGGWRINADFGMMALSPGSSVKFGKVLGGTQSLDDVVRDLRLSPVLQLGVSYSF
jgi:hypothetical protein